MPRPAPPAPAARFALLMAWLGRAVAARSNPRLGAGRLAGPLIILIGARLGRLAARFARLAAQLAAGARPAPARVRRRAAPPRPRRREPLPAGFGWLVRLVPEAAAFGAQLQHLLADPEMAALVAAAPQAGRVLRPLCRMLGVRPPPGPLAPPSRPRAPAPPSPGLTRGPAPPSPGLTRGPAPPSASLPAAAPPRPPTRAWLRRTGLPNRRRPLPLAIPA